MPIVLPLVAGALLVLLEKARSRAVAPLSLLATGALLILAARLMEQAAHGEVQAYLLGNWRAPWGISLALDRLAALMLVLTALVANAGALWFARAARPAGLHFHSLFQFQLMGLCGAFLTADLFNLFVFFELLLAASYGLLLHGGTRAASPGRRALRGVQPGRVGAVPDRGEPAVRRGRHAEPGRPGAQAAAAAARTSGWRRRRR
jgi:multicomponent K+:H+ antiporter subunit D